MQHLNFRSYSHHIITTDIAIIIIFTKIMFSLGQLYRVFQMKQNPHLASCGKCTSFLKHIQHITQSEKKNVTQEAEYQRGGSYNNIESFTSGRGENIVYLWNLNTEIEKGIPNSGVTDSSADTSYYPATLAFCWANVVDGGPTVSERWANVSCCWGRGAGLGKYNVST